MSTRSVAMCVALASLALHTGCASRATTAATPPVATAPQVSTTGLARAHENLHAVLWVQTAIEFRASASQAYRLARQQLDAALADASWTAAVEQSGDASALPPAVVLDLDETVLDNSPFQARAIQWQIAERAAGRMAEGFDPVAWDAWCAEAAAGAVPGAADFLRYARSRGVTPFFVSNRTAPLEAATRRNLDSVGVEASATPDTVLLRNERPEWAGSDKTARRAYVARTHRILLLIGDDLGDFVPADGTVAERDARLESHAAAWGTRWVVIPNPMYGSWERAVLASQPGAGPLETKAAALQPRR